MITYYEKPFKEQAHIHTLGGKMGEITILGETMQGQQRPLLLITMEQGVPLSLIFSPARIMPMINSVCLQSDF